MKKFLGISLADLKIILLLSFGITAAIFGPYIALSNYYGQPIFSSVEHENDAFWGNPALTARFNEAQIEEVESQTRMETYSHSAAPFTLENILSYNSTFSLKDVCYFMREGIPSAYANGLSRFDAGNIKELFDRGVQKSFIDKFPEDNFSTRILTEFSKLSGSEEKLSKDKISELIAKLDMTKPVLDTVLYFNPNVVQPFKFSSQVDQSTLSTLKLAAVIAAKNPGYTVLVLGNSDFAYSFYPLESRDYLCNALSSSRAEYIKKALIYQGYSLGLKESQIITRSYGFKRYVSRDTEKSNLNRRVEIKVYAPVKTNG